MNRYLFTALTALSLIMSSAIAGPFDQVFKLVKITGECTVKIPGAAAAEAPTEGKAYPYGTEITTGRKSTAVVLLSDVNEFRITANAKLTVTEDAKNSKMKIIKLDEGKVDIELEESFHEKTGNDLSVETAAAICGAIGCEFSVQASKVSDLNIAGVVVTEGKIFIKGTCFSIPLLDKEDAVVISAAKDQSYVMIKNIKGNYEIDVKDSKGETKKIALKQNYTIKIFRKVNENTKITTVTILIINPDGKTEDSIVRSFQDDGSESPIPAQEEGVKEGKEQTPETKDETIVTTTTTTSSTTTTSTISPKDRALLEQEANGQGTVTITTTTTPSPTPTGKR